MYLDRTIIIQARKVYDLLDLLGDVGGIMEVVLIVFGTILYSVAEHSFHIQALKRLFKVKTSQQDLFIDASDSDSEKEKEQCKYLYPKRLPPDITPEREHQIK